MDWSDITVRQGEANFGRILSEWWSWLLPTPCRPMLMTAFGDWFLADEGGCIYMLDLLEGAVTRVAESRDDLNAKMSDANQRDQWFLPGFVIAMQRAGTARQPGQCYAYQVHPIIGGRLESANLTRLDIEVWQAICSQLHRQVRQLPTGTRIRGMEAGDGFEIRLIHD